MLKNSSLILEHKYSIKTTYFFFNYVQMEILILTKSIVFSISRVKYLDNLIYDSDRFVELSPQI